MFSLYLCRVRINKAMADMKAEGLLDKIKEKYWDYAGHCENIDGRKFVAKGEEICEYISSKWSIG